MYEHRACRTRPRRGISFSKEQRRQYQKKIKEYVLKQMDLSREISDEGIRELIDEGILRESRERYIPGREKVMLCKEIFNSIRRLDALQELLEDKDITEIMINGASDIFVERGGRVSRWDKEFESRERLEDVIQHIVSGANRIVNESNPIVDVRLEDGSRVNIVLPPVALNGPVVTIRRFPEQAITMEELVQRNSLTREVADFLKNLVEAKYNIFISGGTGAGKTTFLNALSQFIPRDERVITVEDSAELQIQGVANLVRLEVRNANTEGKNGISIRDLIKSALRMRPDRIIVGEVRDSAAIDMIQAMNTGHDGSLSTGHANSPPDMLERLETLVLMGMDIPLQAVQNQISSAIDIIVQLGRLRDKSRRTLEVAEVLGCREGEFLLNPLYTFREKGEDEEGRITGQLEATGNVLQACGKLERAGLQP